MVGANYTGGRRNAAKARSKDTTGRLQRGHFSKQRLGILTDALRSRRPDHQSPPRSTDDPNLASNPRSGSLVPPSGYSTCTPAATVYDISLGHAQRDLARKHPTRHDFSPSISGLPDLNPYSQNDLPAVAPVGPSAPLALTERGEPEPASNAQTLLPATPSTAIPSCPTLSSPRRSQPQPSPHPGPASLPEGPAPVTELHSKRRSKILDLIDISDRELFFFAGSSPAELPVSGMSSNDHHTPTTLRLPTYSHP